MVLSRESLDEECSARDPSKDTPRFEFADCHGRPPNLTISI